MEATGMSLFQGAASILINNSAQDRLEEQEELEDQKRRNEELQHKLASAFDDLQEEDEVSSVNSSGNHTIDTPQTNGVRTGLPPTYIESVNHLKENQHGSDSPKYCETPKNHMQLIRNQDDVLKHSYSPYGAGDGHNHQLNQEYKGHLNGMNNFDGRQELAKYEKLQVLYEMRIKECQQLASTNNGLEQEISSLRGRLQAAVQDKDKAELSLQEAHQLLASGKHKSIEQEQQLKSLREKWEQSERDREQMRLELRAANLAVEDAQQRLHTIQVSHSHGTDALFREQQDRHREEVDRMHSDLIKIKNRLEEKDNEILVLEKRCLERQREKEEVLREKCAAVERAARELQAERRARDLARDQLRDMGDKFKDTAHELALSRKKLAAIQMEHESFRNTLHQILLECLPENTFSLGDPPSPGKLATLKEILSRYKTQIQKLPALQEEIAKRDKRVEQLKKAESELRGELEQLRAAELQLRRDLHERAARLNSEELKVAELEMELEKMKSEKGSRASQVHGAHSELLREMERCNAELRETRAENADLKTLYLQVCSARDAVTRELKDVHTMTQREKEMFRTQERELVERLERERRRGEELGAELAAAREELGRANGRISELQTEFTDKQREFTDKLNKFLEDEKTAMRKEISVCMQCEKQLKHIRSLEEQISKYSVRLAAQESNETLMKELKSKAEFFQKYILERYHKMAEQCSVATNTERSHAPDGQDAPDGRDARYDRDGRDTRDGRDADGRTASPVSDNEEELNAKTVLMMKEKAIRDQIAEKFTLEMKTIEMNCARRLKEMETEQLTAVTRLKSLLERKAKEVDTLKEFILSERAKVTQILESKEKEISVLIKEHNELQADGQRAREELEEWRRKAEKYREKLSQLGSLDVKSEKSSSQECQALKTKVVELHSTISQLEQRCMRLEGEHRALQEKYKNVKRTVLTYKDYMAKKDKHITSEVGRIQEEYRRIFMKLQRQLEARRAEERRPETDYTAKLNEVSQEFARLAQFNLRDNLDQNK